MLVTGPALAIDVEDLDITIRVIDSDHAGAHDIVNRIELPNAIRNEAAERHTGQDETETRDNGHDEGHSNPAGHERERPSLHEDDGRLEREDLRERDDGASRRESGREAASSLRESGMERLDEASQIKTNIRETTTDRREQSSQRIEDQRAAMTDNAAVRDSISEQREDRGGQHERDDD